MNEALKFLLNNKSLAAYRGVVAALMLWIVFGGDFVTKKDYLADKEKQQLTNEKVGDTLESINQTLILLKEQHKVDAAQDKQLEDHEVRLRYLESHQ